MNYFRDFGEGIADVIREQRELWNSDTGKDLVILAIYAVAIIAWGNVLIFILETLERMQ